MKNKLLIALSAASVTIFAADITDNFEGNLWNHWNPPACKVQYKKNPKEGVKGTPCAEIVLLPGNPTDKTSSFMKKFPLISGKQYQAVVMTKNATAGKNGTTSLTLQAFNDKGKYVSTLINMNRKVTGEWQRISCTFKVPKNIPAVMALLGASGDAGSRILFDDFVIRELNPADGIVEHFDSAKSFSYWKHPKSKVSIIYEENDGKEAKGCAGIVVPKENPKGCSGCILMRIPVEKGKEYTFIVQAKSIGFAKDTKVSMSFQGLNEKNGFLGTGVQGTNIKADECRDWKRITYSYKIPTTGKWANCAKLLVTLGVSGNVPGKVLFDDFEYFLAEEE